MTNTLPIRVCSHVYSGEREPDYYRSGNLDHRVSTELCCDVQCAISNVFVPVLESELRLDTKARLDEFRKRDEIPNPEIDPLADDPEAAEDNPLADAADDDVVGNAIFRLNTIAWENDQLQSRAEGQRILREFPWNAIWSAMECFGMVDSIDGAEYNRVTKRMLESGKLRDVCGVLWVTSASSARKEVSGDPR
jgi:hypothetical protein